MTASGRRKKRGAIREGREIVTPNMQTHAMPPEKFVTFQQVRAQLFSRVKASDDDIAMWIYLGEERIERLPGPRSWHQTSAPTSPQVTAVKESKPDKRLPAAPATQPHEGGLQAFEIVQGYEEPQPFHFSRSCHGFDYVSAMQGCLFRPDDVTNFRPVDQFITGAELVSKWRAHCGGECGAKAFIHTKVEEGRLQDLHPCTGMTQASHPGEDAFPPLERALFANREFKAIEASDFPTAAGSTAVLGISPKDFIAKYQHNVLGGKKWLDGFFKGRKKQAGEERECKQFSVGRGEYNEAAMVLHLKKISRYSELGYASKK